MKDTLKENMSPYPVTTHPQESLANAYARMKRERIRHLPVTDKAGGLVGIIAERDFERAMSPTNSSAPFQENAVVADFMSSPVTLLPDDTKLLEVVHLMIEKKISAVIVMHGEEMAGIITHEDLLRVLAEFLQAQTSLTEKLYQIGDSPTVSRFMQLLSGVGI